MSDMHEMNCQEFVELVTEYLEGTLSPADRERFEAHLAYCDPCVDYVEQMRLTIRTLGHLREEHIAPDARRHLLDAFRDWKRSAGLATR